MMFRSKVAVATALSLAALLVVLTAAGCGGSSADTATSGPAAPTTSLAAATSTSAAQATVSTTSTNPTTSTTSSSTPVDPAERQAADAYFAEMAPTIDKDYQGLQWFNRSWAQWVEKYGETDLSTNREAWNALGVLFEEMLAKQQEVARGYEAVTPPEAFRAAHKMLVDGNAQGNAWAEEILAAIKANRPIEDLLPMVTSEPPGPSGSELLAEFNAAAARVGVEVPQKFIDTYTEDTDSGTAM